MIELRRVSLSFASRQPLRLRERLERAFRSARTSRESLPVLRDIDLAIRRGERVGVIGLNGAGKTTLLKTICGIYPPTRGTVRVAGDVACLFELATGFEMEASGWENIVTRGLLLGLPRRQIRARMEEIAEFTELGPALDRPVKTYSSGMAFRLAFAVSTVIRPDVLLLDEVIAAGDARFREKAERRLAEMVRHASVLLLVSHQLETIRETCERVLWVESGRIRRDGPRDEVLSEYAEASR